MAPAPVGYVPVAAETSAAFRLTTGVRRLDESGRPGEMADRVFEPFVQLEDARLRAPSGLGLGLPLVKILTTLHGGTVETQSEGPGRGTSFTVRLARLRAPA